MTGNGYALSQETGARSQTILLVDDDPDVLELGQNVLGFFGYKVMAAASGAEAIQMYQTHTHEIGLVILDMVMPGLSGHQVLQELKRLNRDVHVLVVTGSYDRDDKAAMLAEGARLVLHKPYEIEELTHVVRQLFNSVPV
jgi:CheY-like chemotaxis protein